ncbi:MAG TPA: trypsin-like peptidase domain-containing protein [Planctomycetota bacterium]|nr:trypsin-like peptidase domain-containing protein [Planctomycetota bacterium]
MRTLRFPIEQPMAALFAICMGGTGVPPVAHGQDARATQEARAPGTHDSGAFRDAMDYAQKRCARLYGGGAGREHGYATGLLVSPDGLILAAQGIYLSGESLRVVLPDGRRFEAETVRRSEKLQAVLLKIEAKTPLYFNLAEGARVEQGDWVFAISNAFNVASVEEPLSVSLGIVSVRAEMEARHRTQDVPYEGDILLVDAITSNPGAPGGAVCTLEGKLVGMIGKLFQSVNTRTRINYAVPVDMLQRFVEGKDDEEPPAPPDEAPPKGQGAYVGIRLFKLSGERAPAYVDSVAPGSPAHAAGVRKDDLVLAIGQDVVRTCREYEEAVAKLKSGQDVPFLLKRGMTIKTVFLTLAAKPEKPK